MIVDTQSTLKRIPATWGFNHSVCIGAPEDKPATGTAESDVCVEQVMSVPRKTSLGYRSGDDNFIHTKKSAREAAVLVVNKVTNREYLRGTHVHNCWLLSWVEDENQRYATTPDNGSRLPVPPETPPAGRKGQQQTEAFWEGMEEHYQAHREWIPDSTYATVID